MFVVLVKAIQYVVTLALFHDILAQNSIRVAVSQEEKRK